MAKTTKTATKTNVKLDKAEVKRATKQHKKTAEQCAKAAIAMGWDKAFVKEILNLEWSISSLQSEAIKAGANKKQTQVLIDLHTSAKYEIAGMYALSQL